MIINKVQIDPKGIRDYCELVETDSRTLVLGLFLRHFLIKEDISI